MFKIHHLLKVISLYVILVTLLNSTINGVFGKLIELTDKNLDELVGLIIHFNFLKINSIFIYFFSYNFIICKR